MISGSSLEEPEILGKVPWEIVVTTDDSLGRHGDNGGQSHTETSALI